MGKGKPRSVEKGGLGQNSTVISPGSLKIPPGPVYYPTEEEFKDPLEFISKIRSEAEKYGICKIVPPKSWKPPFSLDLDSFTFRTKSQAIHQLQVRPASCDSKTFELEYVRFLEENGGRKAKKRVVFEAEELDLCRLFNAVKRFGGYDRVVKDKKWGEVFRIVRPVRKDSECAKHVLCQLYREHLYDYEIYSSRLNRESDKSKIGKRMHDEGKCDQQFNSSSSKRRGKNHRGETVEVDKAEEEFDQICEQCRSGLHGEVMLLCDRCNKGWHIYCLSPPLKRIPHGNWYCSECLNSEKDCFGFVTGRRISLDSFRRVADRAKRKWFGSVSTSRVQLEKKFWEIVEGSAGEVEVKYGSDLDTSVYGSGFPRVSDPRPQSIGADLWDKYCASPWNLNNLPKLQGSMLQAVHNSIAGVMVPWLYIGMLFSSFCWHFEDHCFYSMNYLHWGEPKCWYSVPGSEACAFEKVMRNTLPDLFDVQPDLLFQLVTMLNPSVLQDSNVPVYSVLQEPGNFVITFPRSYHGGFNFGLNCAEAVNFAPADWLPHGGFGAGLYQLYRKAAVLSHEELLCVVAKTDLDSKVTPYLKNELLRIYDKEKTWRERLWRNGIVDSSPMSPREQPTYLGIEEDPTCIICQQFLYLSAIGCRCRPSAFVCLEHWEHLCECKANKHRLLYRHTLVELNDMILNVERLTSDETLLNRNSRRQLPCSQDSGALSKKIKGGQVTLVQLAEEWLLKSCRILHKPYSSVSFANVLKEAEQFLWAGSEMDPVRDMTRNLIEAKNWADSVRDCVSKLELWSNDRSHGMERVQMERVRNLLSFDPVPCNEPGHLTLKVYRQEAEVLIQEINSALSTCMEVSIADCEILYVKACDSGILVEESDKLLHKLSSVKIWKDGVRKCISEKSPSTVEVDTLEKLKSEVSELQVQLPEIEMLWDLIKQVESCQSRCSEMLKGSISLKKLELFLREMAGFTVNIPELKLLKQYQNDAMSWISRFKNCVNNAQERDDQENVVDELICILKDGALLKIEVDELSQVEVELKKACCREKAQKALGCKMSLDSVQQLLVEATILQIEKEKLFADISGIHSAALSWEERAKHILLSEAQMSDFEDLIRTSQDICLILPSLDDVNEAVLAARLWLNKSEPFLSSDLSVPPTSKSLLNFGALKELVSQTNLLKISLGESQMLRTVLDNCIQCELDACSLLNDMESLLNKVNDFGDESCKILVEKVQSQVASFEHVVTSGPCLYFDFVVTPKLQDACSTLRCCLKALSFRDDAPAIEEVEMLLEVAGHLPGTYASCELWNSLVVGVNWLKKALEILLPCNHSRFKLSDAEEALHKSQAINISFPVMVGQLANAIKQHKLWVEQVQRFLTVKSADRSYLLLLWLKELGSTDAFNCSELDLVLFEVERVEQWRRNIEDIAGSVGNAKALLCALSEMTNSLDRSLQICDTFTGCKPRSSCIYCSSEIKDQEELLMCSICIHCYHISCMVATCPTLGDSNDDSTKRICPCCEFIKSGKITPSGKQQCPIELNTLIEVSSEAQILPVWIEERDMLRQIIERSHAYKACLTQVVDSVLVHLDENLNIVTQKLSNAFKAVEVAGVYDHDVNGKFELALARNSWRVRARKLVQGSKKPTIQQIQLHLKEGSAISMPSGDHFRQKLEEVKHNGIQWADKAKKVSVDSGALELHKVFELITEGKGLLVDVQKELKLLEERSMLYCICRKPNDRRAMIACDKCDEWYHFDCVKLTSAPKIYICPACKLGVEEDLSAFSSLMMTQERSTGSKCEAPQTPSPRGTESRRRRRRRRRPEEQDESSERRKRNKVEETRGGIENNSGVGGTLLWRNRKPFRRVVRKRQDLNILSPLSSYVKLRQL